MVALNTIACTSKLSQKSLCQKLESIPLIPVVSGVGNYQETPAFINRRASGSTYTQAFTLKSTLFKRTPRNNEHIEMGSTFLYSLQLTLNKTDISQRRTHSVGAKGVCLVECITKSIIKSMTQCNLHCLEFSLTNELHITVNSRLADTPYNGQHLNLWQKLIADVWLK